MNLRKSLILYVDDDSDSCEILKYLLEDEGGQYFVTSVLEVEKALKLMETTVFDLYILDQKMPVMSGVELCRLIRKTNLQVPIMFFSGMSGQPDRRAAMEAGANEYLVKPNDLDILVSTIKKLLSEGSPVNERKYPTKDQIRDRIY